MDAPRLLHALARRRVALALGAVVALAVALAVGGPGSTSSGVAWTRVALDTPRSQVIEADPLGADSLVWRASLLVHLVATEPVKRQIAGRLGVRKDQVAVVDTSLAEPEAPASLPKAAAEAAATTVAPYVLTVYLSGTDLPIIALEAQAPDRRRAARLAAAAADVLKAAAPAAGDPDIVPAAKAESAAALAYPRGLQGFVVEPVAPVRTKAIVERRLPTTALALSVLMFGLWCAGLALGPRLAGLARSRGRLRAAGL